MKSRVLRFALHALMVGLVSAAAYVVWTNESEGAAATRAVGAFDDRVRSVSRTLLDIKSAQPGYVAAGQGDEFWITRVDALLAATREGLASLKPLARVPQAPAELEAAAAAFEDFEHLDRRAREYVRSGQRLLASDLIFSDGIEKLDAAVDALDRARTVETSAAALSRQQQRREQVMAAGGAAALGLLMMFALVPLPRPDAPAPVQSAPAAESIAPPPARLPRRPASAPAMLSTATAPAAPKPQVVRTLQAPPPQPPPPAVDLPGIAALCSDLARILDTRALPAALERAAALLDASGVVIWVADPDGRELSPVIAHGYPQHLLSRMGTIPRDAENATAAAFRTGLVQTVNADAVSPGAIAAPLLTPAGPVGVMAAEVLHDGERRESTRAAATIVAAQLATLMGPPSSSARAQGKTEAAGA